MLAWSQIQNNAVSFSKRWEKTTYEKGEAQSFLNEFFAVFGVDRLRVANFEFRSPKSDGKNGFIDLFWKGRILIEMKSRGSSLEKAYEQARDYAFNIKNDEDLPKFIMVSDFENIRLYNLMTNQVFNLKTKNLSNHVKKFAVLTEYAMQYNFVVDKELNIKAAEKMAKLHDLLLKHGYNGHYLKVYLVRLLFLLFADDSEIFEKDIFRIYITESKENGSDLSERLFKLFYVLDTSIEDREKMDLLSDELKKFAYINGSLFREVLPPAEFDSQMRELLLECCEFDWSTISPAIFGSLFQGVMNKEERRNLGAHYTSEENILKVIKPLFLDNLYNEFEKIKMFPNKLEEFHRKISNLNFLDPACGCGNFLIIAYRELRLLELEVLKMKFDEVSRSMWIHEEIKVNVDQFYGIELEEFPAHIAKVAMWLMDHQMNRLVASEFGIPFNRLPLINSASILNANALQVDWKNVIDPRDLNYIIGNPPFIGTKYQSEEQKLDIKSVFSPLKINNYGVLDYVTGWFIKASQLMKDTEIKAALVSTNSITQGEQVASLWNPMFNLFNMTISYAYRTFPWTNDARGKAAVHCVIIAFQSKKIKGIKKYIFINDHFKEVKNISPYLIEGSEIINSRRKPISEDAPKMIKGSQPTDGGHLILNNDEKENLITLNPLLEKYIKKYVGATDFINNNFRWCLWLVDCEPSEIRKIPQIYGRLEDVRKSRLASKKKATRDKANTPTLFTEIRQPQNDYLLVPVVSSQTRTYIPMGFVSKDVIANTNALMIPNANLYHFGILSTKLHMIWMKTVCGRMKSDYAYSASIVYNNFPWPVLDDIQKERVSDAASEIMGIRKRYLENNTLADLYNVYTMPADLVNAHDKLDKIVYKIYGFKNIPEESEVLEKLFAMYKELTKDI